MQEEKISLEEVKKVALLCKLDFSEDDFLVFQKDLSKILDYITSLKEVDVKEVEPTYVVLAKSNVFEKDDLTPSLSRSEVLDNAKNKDSAYIRTKAVL